MGHFHSDWTFKPTVIRMQCLHSQIIIFLEVENRCAAYYFGVNVIIMVCINITHCMTISPTMSTYGLLSEVLCICNHLNAESGF